MLARYIYEPYEPYEPYDDYDDYYYDDKYDPKTQHMTTSRCRISAGPTGDHVRQRGHPDFSLRS
jgi:hypothetical protein